MKKCIYCAENIQDEAVVCRYCGRELPHQQSMDKPQPVAQLPIPQTKRRITSAFWIVVGVAVLVIMSIAAVNSTNINLLATATPTATITPTATRTPVPTYTPLPMTVSKYANTILPYVETVMNKLNLINSLLSNMNLSLINNPTWQDQLLTEFDDVYDTTQAMIDTSIPEGFERGHNCLENALQEWDLARDAIKVVVFNLDTDKAADMIIHMDNYTSWLLQAGYELEKLKTP